MRYHPKRTIDHDKFAAFCKENALTDSLLKRAFLPEFGAESVKHMVSRLMTQPTCQQTQVERIVKSLSSFLGKPLRAEDVGFSRSSSNAGYERDIEAQKIVEEAVESIRKAINRKIAERQQQMRQVISGIYTDFTRVNAANIERFNQAAWQLSHHVFGEEFYSRHPGGTHILLANGEVINQVKLHLKQRTDLISERRWYAKAIRKKDYMRSFSRGLLYGVSDVSMPVDRPTCPGMIVTYVAIPRDRSLISAGKRWQLGSNDAPIGMMNCVIDCENTQLTTIVREEYNRLRPIELESPRLYGDFRITVADKLGSVLFDSGIIVPCSSVLQYHGWLEELNVRNVSTDIHFANRSFRFDDDGDYFRLPGTYVSGAYAAAAYSPERYFIAASLEINE